MSTSYKKFSELLKDTYNGATAYTIGDIVTYNGSSYACRANTTGNLPTNITYWALLAEKGDTGSQGEQGIQGIQGVQGIQGENGDYFVWKGDYVAETAYIVGDAVSYNGSSYICTAETTGNLPSDTDYWGMLALKGDGDLTAPASSTDNAIARFDGITGKLLQDSIITIPDATATGNTMLPITKTGTGYNFVVIGGSSSDTGNGGTGAVRGGAAIGGDSVGGVGQTRGGTGIGAGAGGEGQLQGGTGGATGAGGAAIVQGGAGGATSGDGGQVILWGGAGTAGNGNGGAVTIAPGAKHGSGANGTISLYPYVGADYGALLDITNIASSDKSFAFPNASGTISTVTSGTSDPTAGAAPAAIGLIYCKTDTGKVYISTGTSAGSDWKILN
jgi:hypothetical protein